MDHPGWKLIVYCGQFGIHLKLLQKFLKKLDAELKGSTSFTEVVHVAAVDELNKKEVLLFGKSHYVHL